MSGGRLTLPLFTTLYPAAAPYVTAQLKKVKKHFADD
jgi:hypothetical protein